MIAPLNAEQVNDYFDSHARAYGRSEFMDNMRAAALKGLLPEGSSDTKRLDWVLGLTPLLICKGRKVEPNRKAIDAELRAPQARQPSEG